MYAHSKKVARWSGGNYFKTILCFAVNYVLLGVLCALAVFINRGSSLSAFLEYFSSGTGVQNFTYLMLAMLIITIVIFLFFYFEKRDFMRKIKNDIMVFAIIMVSLIVSYGLGTINIYIRPIALCALLSLMLIDRVSAIFMNIAACMMMFLVDNYTGANYGAGFSALVIGFSAGLISIYLVSGVSSRLRVLLMGFVIAIPIILTIVILEGFNVKTIYYHVLAGISAGMFSVAFETLLVPLYERIFGRLTPYRVSELTDHKSRLMKKLIAEAPGTFNHSIVVANLAEACAGAIGEDSQMARAAAYYHDVGKIFEPSFYAENQSGVNPHDDLTPELSVAIIMRHTVDGAAILKRYHMPQILIDVALQHHGTLPIRYFYVKACKMTDGELDIKNFSYPGPKPKSKIAAIVMIADGCEAKVRTVKDRTHENVDKAVKEIIEERMDLEQFTDCDITLKDLDIIRASLVNALVGVYHDRVAYPKLKIGKNKVETL